MGSESVNGIEPAARFDDNRLLSTFPDEARALIEPYGQPVSFAMGETVLQSGRHVDHTFFPYGPLMVSLVVDLDDGRSVEVATIGKEGAIGGIVSCGNAPAFTRAQVIFPGEALKVPMERVEEAKARSGHIRNLFCRYADYLLAQVMQSAACNAFHPIEGRTARWLLTALDRSGDELRLTQEALAGLLGAQRTTVNAVAKQLQEEGLISYSRGFVRVLDRQGLKGRSCSCYDEVERFFGHIIGPRGTVWSRDCD